MSEKELDFDSLGICFEDVCRQMGYPDGAADASVCYETDRIVSDVRQWVRPRFAYITRPDIPPSFHPGAVIAHQLRGSEAYALFIATAGMEYEHYLRRLRQRGDVLREYIADALGSVIAERCTDMMEQHLQASIDKLGWHRTNRFSPGYCGWHVSEQQLLFPLFGGRTCGVTLTADSLMVPVKTVSGIIGLGGRVSRNDYLCQKGKDGILSCERCRLQNKY